MSGGAAVSGTAINPGDLFAYDGVLYFRSGRDSGGLTTLHAGQGLPLNSPSMLAGAGGAGLAFVLDSGYAGVAALDLESGEAVLVAR